MQRDVVVLGAGIVGLATALKLQEAGRSVALVDRQAAEASQLMIEYDPQPPFDSGSLDKASEATRLLAAEYGMQRS